MNGGIHGQPYFLSLLGELKEFLQSFLCPFIYGKLPRQTEHLAPLALLFRQIRPLVGRWNPRLETAPGRRVGESHWHA
jgi:hypothetical protein